MKPVAGVEAKPRMAAFPPWILRLRSDARLAALAARGYAPAFEALAERHRPALLRTATRLGGGAEAEDCVQQTLLQAWQALRQGTEVRSPRAWLFAILRHVLAARSGAPPLHLSAEIPGREDVAEQATQRLAVAETLAAIARLPESQRAALLAQELAGASRKELAAALGVSEAGVRSLLYRARSALRAAVGALVGILVLRRLSEAQEALAQTPPTATNALATAAPFAGKAAAGLAAVAAAVGGFAAAGGISGKRSANPLRHNAQATPARAALSRPASSGERRLSSPSTPSKDRQRQQVATAKRSAAGQDPVGEPVPPRPPAVEPATDRSEQTASHERSDQSTSDGERADQPRGGDKGGGRDAESPTSDAEPTPTSGSDAGQRDPSSQGGEPRSDEREADSATETTTTATDRSGGDN